MKTLILSISLISISNCFKRSINSQFLFNEQPQQKLIKRALQDDPYTLLEAQLQKIQNMNISETSNDTKNLVFNLTLQAMQAVADTSLNSVSSQDLNTSTEIYNSSEYQIVGLKSSKFYMLNYLATPPAPILGTTSTINPTDAINNDTIFEISSIRYWVNPFSVDLLFPYYNSTYPIISTYIKANQENFTSLPYSLALLFNTGMQWNGTSNSSTSNDTNSTSDESSSDESSSDENSSDETAVDELSPMDLYMENAKLLTCIQQNQTGFWIHDGCDQNIIIHPNGKVLIQCNCNETNQTVTLVNDTNYYFNNNPDQAALSMEEVVMLEFFEAAMFWLLLSMTILWGFFMLWGRRRDAKDLYDLKVMQYKRLQARKSMEARKLQKRNSIRKPTVKSKVFQKVELNDKNEEENKIKLQVVEGEHQQQEEEIVLHTELEERKSKDLIPAHKVQRSDDVQVEQKQDQKSYEEEEQFYQNEEEEQRQDRMMADNSEEVENQSNKEGSSGELQEEQKQIHQVRFSLKPNFEENLQSNQNQEEQQINKEENQGDDKKEENHEETKEELDEKTKRAMKPLPPLTVAAFKEIFLNLHDFWNIWFFYKKKIPRYLRFFGNLCKNLLMAGLSSQFVDMFPLWMNVALMVPAILIVQFGDNVGAILFKQKSKAYHLLGIIDLCVMLGISIYIYVGMFKSLPLKSHDIWFETFIIIYFLELLVIETLVIGLKTLLQPLLKKYYTSENQIIRILYISFWDVKVQNIWRREYKKSGRKRNTVVDYRKFLK